MNRMKDIVFLWSVCWLLQIVLYSPARGQTRYTVTRISGPVKLDGLSIEPAWQTVKPLPVIMQEPNYGKNPSEKTEVRIAYDDDYLYVAARCYDHDPSKIQAPSKKRDEMSLNNDWFGIIIDTFNDKENALAFFTTPAGLRLDMTVFNDAQGDFPLNSSWNTFWDVASQQNEEGWHTEMRIPLSSLRFQDDNGTVVMGFITWRWIARKQEVVLFPQISQQWGFWGKFKPSQAREIVFNGVHSRNPLYITPYLLGGISRTARLNEAETAYDHRDKPAREIGLDVKYGLTSNLTMDVTVNTDFAQVEADNQQINLTRFSLFFPEKRLFFQERSSNFEFNFGGSDRLFYSRRIGIQDGKRVPIYGGARMVGRVGHWDVGFLSMQTAPLDSLRSENFSVLRLRRQIVNENTYVGGILTSRLARGGNYNSAYGLDGVIRIFSDDYLTLHWAQTFENNRSNHLFSLQPARISMDWERRTLKGLGYLFYYSRAGKLYNPGIGFERRENFSRYEGHLLFGWLPGEKSSLLRHQIYLNGFLTRNNRSGLTESAESGPSWQFVTKTGYTGEIEIKLYYEDIPDTFSLSDQAEVPTGRYTFTALNIDLGIPSSGLFNINGSFNFGSFYDGRKLSFEIAPAWSISSSIRLSGFYQFNSITFPGRAQSFTAHISRLRARLMLNTKFAVGAFVQYNSAGDAVVANIRFRYNPREGNDLYLVYDGGFNTNRFRDMPVLPVTSNRTVLLKYSYTFNL